MSASWTPGPAGTPANDTFSGGDDTILGGPGNDILLGGGGGASIVRAAGDGGDAIRLGTGADTLHLEGWTGRPPDPWDRVAGPLGATLFDRTDGSDTLAMADFTAGEDAFACFAEGTRIATARGEVPVEALRVGDLVVTARGGAGPLQPVVWMGRMRIDLARHRRRAAVAPVRIAAGALAEGVPHRDLRLSPGHAILLDGRLVPVGLLVNGTSILREGWCLAVTYWHVEVPAHGLLVAEGAAAESYLDDGNRRAFDNHKVTMLLKDMLMARGNGRYDAASCLPLLRHGPLLDRLRARLAARADALAPARRRLGA